MKPYLEKFKIDTGKEENFLHKSLYGHYMYYAFLCHSKNEVNGENFSFP